jgi:hypothetical protein
VVILEKVLKIITERFREEVIIVLLEQKGADMVIIEEVVKIITERFREEVIIVLLE